MYLFFTLEPNQQPANQILVYRTTTWLGIYATWVKCVFLNPNWNGFEQKTEFT